MSAIEESAVADQPPHTKEVRWVALGDSFTAGLAAYERTWATMTEQRLAGTRPIQLLNLARVGARCADVASEQLPRALESEPTLITVICGANDVVRSVRPDLERTAEELDQLYERIRAWGPNLPVLTATYPAVAPDALGPRTSARIAAGISVLNALIRRLAAEHEVAVAELATHRGQADLTNYAEDGLHPSPAGHRAAADVLAPAIQKLIDPAKGAT